MHAPRRFVESSSRLVSLDRLVIDGVLVFALQDVSEHRTSVAVRRIFLTGLEGHFHNRRTGVLPVQFFDDVPLGQLSHLYLALPV